MSRQTTAAPQLHMQRERGGRYEIGQEIARGGMGVILAATDRFTQREVAFKRLLVRNDASRARLTSLFQREYDTLARLPHPNIVEVYDYGHDRDGPYYVMELLKGDDLGKIAPLPFRSACRVLRDVASALALIHARRLIHRDVSPGNVKLTADGRAKLIDFGGLTRFGKPTELVGTPACMAPECLSGEPLDQRSDLYALGAVGYWLMTRRMAVPASTLEDLEQAFRSPMLAPSMYVTQLPRELDDLIVSLLSRDPLARPVSAAHVIERLTTIADLAPEAEERRVAYSYLARPPLVGRKDVREALCKAVDCALEAQGRVVLVEAAAGLGRSALLDDVALYAQLSSASVLRAEGDHGSSAFTLARKIASDLSVLHPDLEDELGARESFNSYHPADQKLARVRSAMEVAERHAQVITSVQETVLAAAARLPLVLLIDDVTAVDEESLALLAGLAQSVAGKRLSIIASAATTKNEERSPAFAMFEESAERFSLGWLGEPEVSELVTSVFGDVPNSRRLAQWLMEQTGGNPGTMMDLSRMLLARGAIRYTLGTFTLPTDPGTDVSAEELAKASLSRMNEMSERARRISALLSVHQGALEPPQLEHALSMSQGEVALALQELVSQHLANKSANGFVLASGSLVAALARSLGSEQKRAAHEQIARALLATASGDLEPLLAASTHLLHAGREDEAAEVVAQSVRTLRMPGETGARWSKTLEAVLAVYRRQGRRKERCLTILLPLVRAGFYGDYHAQLKHGDLALDWMAEVSGMRLAQKLRRYLGGKLALLVGVLYCATRRAFVPKAERIGTVREVIAEFVGLAGAMIAAAASALDGSSASRIVRHLEPLRDASPGSGAALLYEFCLATTHISLGEFEVAAERYAKLLEIFERPLKGLEDAVRRDVTLGCLNGCAQAEATAASPKTLELADALGEDPFFAPHAECARMTYYGYRGERDKAEQHRAKAELLALRGGASWSALAVLSVRAAYISMLNHDAIGLLHAINDLERFAALVPRLHITKALAEARLEHLRGKAERAVELFERVIDGEEARSLASWRIDRGFYAAALNAAGRFARAREVCIEVLGPDLTVTDSMARRIVSIYALAEAGLGNREKAIAVLDQHIRELAANGNPLTLGSTHRDRARVAMMMGEKDAYELHSAEMKRHFAETKNPSLITQIEVCEADAQRSGISSSGHVLHSGVSQVPGAEDDDFDGSTVLEGIETKERETLVRDAK